MASSPQLYTALASSGQAYQSYTAGEQNRKIDRYNASLAKQQAEESIQTGGFAAAREATKGRIIGGAQTANFAGQGVVAGAGTARSVTASTEATSAMDQMLITINARRQAFGYQVKAAGDVFQGDLARYKGISGAGAALMSGASELQYENSKEGGGESATKKPASSLTYDMSGGADLYDYGNSGTGMRLQ